MGSAYHAELRSELYRFGVAIITLESVRILQDLVDIDGVHPGPLPTRPWLPGPGPGTRTLIHLAPKDRALLTGGEKGAERVGIQKGF